MALCGERMQKYTVDSSYRQFYIADAGLDPDAPEDWSDLHVEQRFNALRNIVALCPEGDITARIICVPPSQSFRQESQQDFEVTTQITIETGQLAVYGWPRELLEEYLVPPSVYLIMFRGYNINLAAEELDYYTVEFKHVA